MTRRLEARYRDEDDEDDVRYDESDCQTVVQIDDWHKKQQEHFAQIQLQSDVSEKIIKKTRDQGRRVREPVLVRGNAHL